MLPRSQKRKNIETSSSDQADESFSNETYSASSPSSAKITVRMVQAALYEGYKNGLSISKILSSWEFNPETLRIHLKKSSLIMGVPHYSPIEMAKMTPEEYRKIIGDDFLDTPISPRPRGFTRSRYEITTKGRFFVTPSNFGTSTVSKKPTRADSSSSPNNTGSSVSSTPSPRMVRQEQVDDKKKDLQFYDLDGLKNSVDAFNQLLTEKRFLEATDLLLYPQEHGHYLQLKQFLLGETIVAGGNSISIAKPLFSFILGNVIDCPHASNLFKTIINNIYNIDLLDEFCNSVDNADSNHADIKYIKARLDYLRNVGRPICYFLPDPSECLEHKRQGLLTPLIPSHLIPMLQNCMKLFDMGLTMVRKDDHTIEFLRNVEQYNRFWNNMRLGETFLVDRKAANLNLISHEFIKMLPSPDTFIDYFFLSINDMEKIGRHLRKFHLGITNIQHTPQFMGGRPFLITVDKTSYNQFYLYLTSLLTHHQSHIASVYRLYGKEHLLQPTPQHSVTEDNATRSKPTSH